MRVRFTVTIDIDDNIHNSIDEVADIYNDLRQRFDDVELVDELLDQARFADDIEITSIEEV